MSRERRFQAGDTVRFTEAARQIKNWHEGRKYRTAGTRTIDHYPTPTTDDVLLTNGELWGDLWLERVPEPIRTSSTGDES